MDEKGWGTAIIIFLLAAIAGKLGVFDDLFGKVFSASTLIWVAVLVVGFLVVAAVWAGIRWEAWPALQDMWEPRESRPRESTNPDDPIAFVAEYKDGSTGLFEIRRRERAVSQRIAAEWQKAGRLRPGKIVRVYENVP